ncbi:MAG TPA: ABC transporter substrate-binding protein [Polyangiaceae bacterium]|nr:ABC transporter substrate-binding protein [Polyangiaceae bacterium]
MGAATTACSSSEPDEPAPSVEIFSWWSSPGETEALQALLQVHHRKYPEVRVINAAEVLADKARARLADRMRHGLPPDTFQANIGQDLFQWVLFDRRDDKESKVSSINALADAQHWFGVLPKAIVDALSFNGQMYGVPLDIHRLNTLFYNRKLLSEAGLQPPTTLAELHATLATLKAAGYTHPISIGNRYDWTMVLFTLENLFPAVAGPDFYAQYWRGEHLAEHAKMRETIAELLSLWPYFNADALEVDWTEGVDRLFARDKAQQAAFTVMGDWAKGYLQAEGYEPGRDFGSTPFPGSEGTFVFTADCFPLPKGAPHKEAVTDLLVTFGSRAGQVAFNQLKGSLPARTDIDPKKDLDSLAQVTWRDFQHDKLVSALSGLLDADFSAALRTAVRETLVDQDPDPLLFALRNNL